MAERKTGFAHALYTGAISYSFVGRRKVWYILSAVLIAISVLGLAVRGLNLGIDFRGGVEFNAPVAVSAGTTDTVRSAVTSSGVSDLDGTEVVTVGSDHVRVQTRPLSPSETVTIREALARATHADSGAVTYSNVGAQWGQQITNKGLQALAVFLVLVMLLIWIYFREWKMSVSAVIAMLHDVIVTVGVYALVGFTVTPSTLIGVLTILGYSLYDTVVVFDKVRENTADLNSRDITYSEGANRAVNQVLVRSINTTIIGVLPVAALLFAGAFLLGSGPLEDLGLALFVGMIVGAYSSIFIATPILAQLREREPEVHAHTEAVLRRRAKAAQDAPKVSAQTVRTEAAGVADLPESVPGADAPSGSSNRSQNPRTTRSQRKK
ncbi:protein translocase subunit SecF [Acidipropionibacterium jensenii]|uniref:protein translocase subunit SecF n=1 Tax=Acidipropionibacterium jensenii TaxID=1749 RepID=UPI00264884DD|nr:protein translocase subunit SecF [Acidipropionibacterium jensenii]MDN5977486.1 protein translocase subunit SecF [Acidipropionibacterium jensenii]MDN6427234.1 protein translocase subunit SecF [Acidipropionibacterium jensenii]MDN6480559.1 protein translocase subunit SecF [Acidipropionibacterium jensenii]MDN6592275.1 protein translocase subunit SecF [Acidipropionibacterium jensenii]MDN6658611.1 protein translocase subunit SecF [Acidipropionibacterium jensenii]